MNGSEQMRYVGHGPIYMDPHGRLAVDRHRVRMSGESYGERYGAEHDADFSGAGLFNPGPFGGSGLFNQGTGDFGDGDFGDGEGFFGDAEMGAANPRLPARRQGTMTRAQAQQQARHLAAQAQQWGITVVPGKTATVTSAQTATISIVLQHDFRLRDVRAAGSTPGSSITSLQFGDQLIYPTGDIPVELFSPTAFSDQLIENMELSAGLSIVAGVSIAVEGSPASGVVKLQFIGTKPRQLLVRQ